MKFAFVSCQQFEDGFYTAYEHLAEEDLDCVVHVGDYIYEDGASAGALRRHVGDELATLDDCRNRHAQYRGDANLQAAHARFPFIVTWDDHEVEKNYAGLISEDNDVPGAPRCRPTSSGSVAPTAPTSSTCRSAATPLGASAKLYRRFRFGRLAELSVLDPRQYRTNRPCGSPLDQAPATSTRAGSPISSISRTRT
jgi:alkaline phosphatase D